MYAADMMARGLQPLPPAEWIKAASAMQAPITPAMGQRTAPAGSIEERLLREAERKRRMGPPPGMLPQRP
jgi:hypothetical protein